MFRVTGRLVQGAGDSLPELRLVVDVPMVQRVYSERNRAAVTAMDILGDSDIAEDSPIMNLAKQYLRAISN